MAMKSGCAHGPFAAKPHWAQCIRLEFENARHRVPHNIWGATTLGAAEYKYEHMM